MYVLAFFRDIAIDNGLFMNRPQTINLTNADLVQRFPFRGFWSKLATSIHSFVLYSLYTQLWWSNACFPRGNSNILLLGTCKELEVCVRIKSNNIRNKD